jgi:hypothetical protein
MANIYIYVKKHSLTTQKFYFNKYFKTEFELFQFYVPFSGFTGLAIDKWKKK